MPTVFHALDEGPDIVVGRSPILVGRHPVCDLRLESFRVSRRHCTLVEIDGAVLVHDLSSTNGTTVNGRRVSVGWAHPGDEVSLAGVRYRVGAGDVDAEGAGACAGVETVERPSHRESVPPAAPGTEFCGPLSEI